MDNYALFLCCAGLFIWLSDSGWLFLCCWGIYLWYRHLDRPPTLSSARPKYRAVDFSSCEQLQAIYDLHGGYSTYADECLGSIKDLTPETLVSYINPFPEIVPLSERHAKDPHKVHWGMTSKDSDQQIRLNSDLVEALEKAKEGSDLWLQLKFLVVVAILRELSHHITKVVFGPETIPPGVGFDGELGTLLERSIVGGIVKACWYKEQAGEMDKIVKLTLEHSNEERDLPPNMISGYS